MAKHLLLLVLVAFGAVCIAGCFPGAGHNTETNPAGFFTGIWHGWIAPLSLVLGLFDQDVRIYEGKNAGWWYDCGFYIAVISGFGGIAFSRRKRKTDRASG